MEEVNRLAALEGAEINKAKEILAYEVTKIVHGEEEAIKADTAAKALFKGGAEGGSIPTTEITKEELVKGMDILTLLQKTNLVPSRSEGRRLIQQGGIKVQNQKISDIDYLITEKDFENSSLMIQKVKSLSPCSINISKSSVYYL